MALHSWPGAGRYAPENGGVCEGALWVMRICCAVAFIGLYCGLVCAEFFAIFQNFSFFLITCQERPEQEKHPKVCIWSVEKTQ